MRRTTMGVGAFESHDLGAPSNSRYMKHILWIVEKILDASEVEESIQKMRKSQT